MKIVRDSILCKNITFIDGLPGSGKSLVAPLISSFSNAELWKLNHIYEYILILLHEEKITFDAAASLLKIYADLDLYNLSISREVNYRPSDDSSTHQNLLHNIYLERENSPDGEQIANNILEQAPSLVVMTHFILDKLPLLERVFSDRNLNFVYIVRNPATVIRSWYEGRWFDRFNKDPREFTLVGEVDGKVIPWFARKNAPNTYQDIDHLAYFVKEYFLLQGRQGERLVRIRFEDFETNPDKYLSMFEDFYGDRTSATEDLLDKFSLPRKDSRGIRDSTGKEDLNFILPLLNDSHLRDEIIELHNVYIGEKC